MSMLKKLLSIWMTFVLVFCSAATNALAAVLTLPADLQIIEKEAFSGTASLDEVVVQEGTTEIQSKAFADSSMNSIELPESVTYIADDAFDGVEELSVTAPEGSYAAEWWEEQNPIEDVYISTPAENFTYIDLGNTFCAITGYTGSEGDIILPKKSPTGHSVQMVFDKAFYGNECLTSVVIPEGVLSIGALAFGKCINLSSVQAPNELEVIKTMAFMDCTNLMEINLPENLLSIEESAFYGCKSLKSVIIPDKITAIARTSFYNCNSLEDVTIPEGVTTIDEAAFSHCVSLATVSLPNSIVELGDDVFAGCDDLKNVNLGNKLKIIGEGAFSFCPKLNRLNIPSSVHTIKSHAFSQSPFIKGGLETITLPDSLQNMGTHVFTYCTNLTHLEWPDSLKVIGENTFYGCSSLRSISIPEGVTDIGDRAFQECTNLTALHLPNSIRTIGSYAFAECSSLTIDSLPDALTTINDYSFESCESLTKLIIPSAVKTIGKHAFQFCYSITSVYLPESVTLIDEYAFAECHNVSCYYIPSSVIQIGTNAISLYLTCKMTIYGKSGSCAETYALENGIPFSTDPFPGTETEPPTAPKAPSFTMDATTVSTGVEVTFHVQSDDASMVQLMVDGSAYDMKVVDNGTAVLSRAFTLAGVREVAFRAYLDGVWGEPCAAQILTVEAGEQLDAPVVTCETKIWTGDSLTVTWDAVENAEGYTVYLTDVNGAITSWEYGTNLRTHTIPAECFSTTGECNVLVMAYGTGYSQSTTRTYITVTDEYIPWTGYVQYSTTNTYSTSACATVNGYVDYIDPVTVLGEENGAYLIEMILTSGGTAQRWVVKSAIGKNPYVPELTLEASYTIKNDQAILRAKTNLQGVKAGVMLNDAFLGTSSTPQSNTTYTRTFSFSIAVPDVETIYTIWAEDASGYRLTATVNIPAYLAPTPTPEVTVSPTPTSSEEPAVTPEPTATPEDSADENEDVVALPSQPQTSEAPVSCEDYVNGIHEIVLSKLENMSLLCLDNGRLKVLSATCTKCGSTVDGYVPEETPMQFYFHPLLKYYDTSGNNTAYVYFSSYKSLMCNAPLTISTDINLNGASLTVSGKLTVEGHLNNVSSINCAELEIKEGGRISMVNGGYVNVSGKITVNGVITGADHIQCSGRFYVGSTGVMAMVPSFILNAGGKFEFHSDADHTAYFSNQSKITAAGMNIRGTNFQFAGTFASTDKSLSMDNTDQNYVATLDLTALDGLVDYSYGKFTTTLPVSTKVRFDSLICETYTKYAWIVQSDLYNALYPVGNKLLTPVLNSKGEVDEQFYADAVEEELNKDYGIEKPVYDVTLSFATTEGVLADEAASVVSQVLEDEDIFARPTDKNGIIKLGSIQYGLYTSSDEELVYKYDKNWTVTFNGFSSILSSDATTDISKVKLYSGTVTCTSEGSGFKANYIVTSTKESLQDAAASIVNIGEAEFKEIQKSLLADVVDDALYMLATKATVEVFNWNLIGNEYTIYDGDFVEMSELMDSLDKYIDMYDDVQSYLEAAQNVTKYHN